MAKDISKTKIGPVGTKFHYRARKSLGQNFLTAKGVVSDIVKSAEIKRGERVLEIGPGKGILTAGLLSAGADLIAVEKDTRMISLLEEKFAKEIKTGRLELVEGDILNLQPTTYNLQPGSYKLVANIPYYITGEIIRHFIGGKSKPSLSVLLVQKEVAGRIVERDGKGSVLSISIGVYGKPKYVKKIPARYFSPAPKVDSAILLIKNIRNPFKEPAEEERFFKILKTGFAHKRKRLAGNLSGIFGKENLEKVFKICGIDGGIRAENLKLKDWLCLSKL